MEWDYSFNYLFGCIEQTTTKALIITYNSNKQQQQMNRAKTSNNHYKQTQVETASNKHTANRKTANTYIIKQQQQ